MNHKFVQQMPECFEPNTLYISIDCAVAIHLCACGCHNRVITPLAPHLWTLEYNGENVSLKPSIGNYKFPCQSHYFIRKNKIIYAKRKYDED